MPIGYPRTNTIADELIGGGYSLLNTEFIF